MCSANHYEAQIYYRVSQSGGHASKGKGKGRKESVGTFSYNPEKWEDMAVAAEKAARAADRANVMLHELRKHSKEHIQKRLNVWLTLA
jgi:hypothetical protein